MSTTGTDDAAEWTASLAGDGHAFAALFQRHKDRVFRHALRLVNSASDADEVAGAAFFELWHRREHVHLVDGSVLPWTLATTTYLALNAARAKRRYRLAMQRVMATPANTDPAEEALRRVGASRGESDVARALAHLGPVDLQLISLTWLEGYSINEAATAVGITPSAARTRLSRARTRVQRQMQPGLAPLPEEVEHQP